jgi:transposase
MARPGRPKKKTAEAVVKNIKRQTRRKFSAVQKIRILLEGLKGEESIAQVCRRKGIAPALYLLNSVNSTYVDSCAEQS